MTKCTVSGCNRDVAYTQLCGAHYYRTRKYGDPHKTVRTPKEVPLFDRLSLFGWDEVIRVPELGACWEWKGNTDWYGYGVLKFEGKTIRAHRAMWEKTHQKAMPRNRNALHKCDNPPCVNPDHIWPGTQAENVFDMHRKGRNSAGRTLTEAQVTEMKRLYRTGKYRQRDVETLFNSSKGQMSRIMNRKIWAWVP